MSIERRALAEILRAVLSREFGRCEVRACGRPIGFGYEPADPSHLGLAVCFRHAKEGAAPDSLVRALAVLDELESES